MYRPHGSETIAEGELWRENLQQLTGLLGDKEPFDLFLKAAVLRALGQFEAARQVLGRLTHQDYGGVVRQLLALCEEGDSSLRELQLGE